MGRNETLFILDGPSYAYRAYYAIRALSNSRGTPTNAVFGFAKTLRKLVAEFSPNHLVVAFDAPGPTFRHAKYEEYKSQRKPMPEDLRIQIPLIRELLSAFRIPIVEKEGFEADDVMGTLASQGKRAGMEVYLVTGDKDMFQLVDEKVRILQTHKDNKIYGREEVKESFGIEPQRFVDVLALAGDSSDNIPGVPGVGEKTALSLVKEFGDLESVLANVESIPGEKRRESLRTNAQQARMSRELAVIDTAVPIQLDLEATRFLGPDEGKLSALYRELEFRALLGEMAPEREDWQSDYRLIGSGDELAALLAELRRVQEIAIDVQTTGPDPFNAELLGMALSFREGLAYYLPCNGGLGSSAIISALKPFLQRKEMSVVGHNVGFAMHVLAQGGAEMEPPAFDTAIAAYVLSPTKQTYSLASLAIEYLHHKMTPVSDLIGTGARKIGMREVPLEKLSRYSCERAEVSLRLKRALEGELRERNLEKLFREIEMPLVPVLARMERAGVFVDRGFLNEMSGEFQHRVRQLTDRIYGLAGEVFNLDSPRQLSRILFRKLKLPVQRRTKTGASTDVSVLEKLAGLHDLPKTLLDYRQLAKLKSTYIDALPALINARTGRVHTSFNQTATATGRLSSSNPNLQNIPVRTDLGRRIRRAFVPEREGWVLLSADYSQIELRIFAHLAQEKAMMEAFRRGQDIHAYTASLMYGVPLSEVSEPMRYRAKAVNFGIIYGQQAYGLSTQLKISVAEAESFLRQYYARYPAVKRYMEDTVARAEETGFVTTLFDRRREIPQLKSKSSTSRQNGRRMAINTPVQGSAADIIKVAMINIDRRLLEENFKAKMIIQIHDELVFELPEEELGRVREMVVEEMESVRSLSVPLKVDTKVGKNWAEI